MPPAPHRRHTTTWAEFSRIHLAVLAATDFFSSAQSVVEYAKQTVPRCLSVAQHKSAYLDPAPPAWCIELNKWPYDTPEWKTVAQRHARWQEPAASCLQDARTGD
jgi:hypothetical protein